MNTALLGSNSTSFALKLSLKDIIVVLWNKNYNTHFKNEKEGLFQNFPSLHNIRANEQLKS